MRLATATQPSTLINLAQLQREAELLPDAPKKYRSSEIGQYTPIVSILRDKGYTWAAIQQFFNDRGVKYHATSLQAAYKKTQTA